MGTRKNQIKSNKRFRKTRSKHGGRDSGRDDKRLSDESIEDILHFYYDQEDISDKITRCALKEKLKKLKYNKDDKDYTIKNFEDQAWAKVYEFIKYNKTIEGGKRKTRSKRQKGGVRNLNEELIDASSFGNLTHVNNLLDYGVDVNALDGQGKPAIYWASFNGHAKVVAILLDYGADVNFRDAFNKDSLYWANFNRHAKVVELLNLHKERLRLQDQKNAEDLLSELDVGNRGDGTLPPELQREIYGYLGGKRKTRKSNKIFRKTRSNRNNVKNMNY